MTLNDSPCASTGFPPRGGLFVLQATTVGRLAAALLLTASLVAASCAAPEATPTSAPKAPAAPTVASAAPSPTTRPPAAPTTAPAAAPTRPSTQATAVATTPAAPRPTSPQPSQPAPTTAAKPAATAVSRPASTGPTSTPFFANYWGNATLKGEKVPVSAVVEAFNPRGDLVGRFVVNTAGYYGYMRVFGEDTVSSPPIPGMRSGETIIFKINGTQAKTSPSPASWKNSPEPAQLDLAAD